MTVKDKAIIKQYDKNQEQKQLYNIQEYQKNKYFQEILHKANNAEKIK